MLTKINNGIIEANGDMFIIPNSFIRLSEEDKESRLSVQVRDIFSHYNMTPEDDELMTQVWIVAKDDLGTENLTDHGCHFMDEDERKYASPHISIIPTRIFEDKKEGDIVDVQFKHHQSDPEFECEFILHLRLAQSEYRYRRFGQFEEVFEKLKATAPKHREKAEEE